MALIIDTFLSLSNESMTSLAYPKSYEYKIILYTTQSINRDKDGYNLTFHILNTSFCITHIAFNSYIFVTGRNDSDQKASDGINNFTVRYPHLSRQKSKNSTCFLLSTSIAILFSLKHDLNVIWKILSMISKFVVRNIFFLLSQ